MKTDFFETKEQQEEAVVFFRNLLQDPGWQLMAKIVAAKIDDLRNEIENGVENETTAEIQNRRNLLKAHRWFIEFPIERIKDFTEKPEEEFDPDPYPKHKIIEEKPRK